MVSGGFPVVPGDASARRGWLSDFEAACFVMEGA